MNRPLFERIQEGERPLIQRIDQATVRWMKKKANPKKILITAIIPDWTSISWNEINQFIPHKKDFLNHKIYQSIHGVSHATRVIILSVILSKQFRKPILPEVLIASGYHDIRRKSDTRDSLHTKRVSQWIKKSKLPFDSNILEKASNLLIKSETEHSNILVKIIRDSDALDRYRLPSERWWPNPIFLTKKSKSFLPFAKYFVWRSESLIPKHGKTNAIRQTAIELGIINQKKVLR